MLPDWLPADELSALSGIAIAVATAFYGLFQYTSKKNHEKLVDIVRPLLEEYNGLDEAELAIGILDDVDYEFRKYDDVKAFELYPDGIIGREDLPLLLRDHKWVNTSDEEEKVRASFDALLYFFAELDYTVGLNLIKSEQLELFKYEIQNAAEQDAISNFIQIYKLSFKGRIDKDKKLIYKEAKDSVDIVGSATEVAEYRQRLWRAGYREERMVKGSWNTLIDFHGP